jgi:hypothetical protein
MIIPFGVCYSQAYCAFERICKDTGWINNHGDRPRNKEICEKSVKWLLNKNEQEMKMFFIWELAVKVLGNGRVLEMFGIVAQSVAIINELRYEWWKEKKTL